MNNYFFLNNQYQIPYNTTTPPASPLVYNYNTPINTNSAVRYKTVALISRDNSKPINNQYILKANISPISQNYNTTNSFEPFLTNNNYALLQKNLTVHQNNDCFFPLSPLKKMYIV